MRRDFREFKVGEAVRILDDRREDWQPVAEFEIAEVTAGDIRASGHPQRLKMTDGQVFSGWWFDPAARCPWAKTSAELAHTE